MHWKQIEVIHLRTYKKQRTLLFGLYTYTCFWGSVFDRRDTPIYVYNDILLSAA